MQTDRELINHKHQQHVEYTRKFNPTWNKGLNKKTSHIVLQSAKTLKKKYESGQYVSAFKGKHWSPQQRKRISQQRKQYLEQHPDRVPYLLNHSSKISYPQRYFKIIFLKQNIDLKYHLQVGLYQLDFYNLQNHKYIEIDGESHYLDKKTIEIDIRRTKYLQQLGWQCIRIRWKQYKKLNLEQRKREIQRIKLFVQN